MARKHKAALVRVHVSLTEAQYNEITELSWKTDLSFAELMRRAVDSYLANQRKKAKTSE